MLLPLLLPLITAVLYKVAQIVPNEAALFLSSYVYA